MGQHRVIVWGEPHDVTTYRKSKTVWICSGEYNGESYIIQDQTEGASVKRWREWAQYKGG